MVCSVALSSEASGAAGGNTNVVSRLVAALLHALMISAANTANNANKMNLDFSVRIIANDKERGKRSKIRKCIHQFASSFSNNFRAENYHLSARARDEKITGVIWYPGC